MSEGHYQAIIRSILEGEDDRARQEVVEALESGLEPIDVLQNGVLGGISKAGQLWKENEIFLPDVILAADAFTAAMEPLNPLLRETKGAHLGKKVVLGTVRGDVHELGKKLVATMLTAVGFEVTDLGINVEAQRFIEEIRDAKPAILGLGAYMTTTMLQMREIISELDEQGMRDGVKLIVGGVPTSQEFAIEVGADAWGKDALDAAGKALELVGVR